MSFILIVSKITKFIIMLLKYYVTFFRMLIERNSYIRYMSYIIHHTDVYKRQFTTHSLKEAGNNVFPRRRKWRIVVPKKPRYLIIVTPGVSCKT